MASLVVVLDIAGLLLMVRALGVVVGLTISEAGHLIFSALYDSTTAAARMEGPLTEAVRGLQMMAVLTEDTPALAQAATKVYTQYGHTSAQASTACYGSRASRTRNRVAGDDALRTHLQLLHADRAAHTEAEASVSLRRALARNAANVPHRDWASGDVVYYWTEGIRPSQGGWHGPPHVTDASVAKRSVRLQHGHTWTNRDVSEIRSAGPPSSPAPIETPAEPTVPVNAGTQPMGASAVSAGTSGASSNANPTASVEGDGPRDVERLDLDNDQHRRTTADMMTGANRVVIRAKAVRPLPLRCSPLRGPERLRLFVDASSVKLGEPTDHTGFAIFRTAATAAAGSLRPDTPLSLLQGDEYTQAPVDVYTDNLFLFNTLDVDGVVQPKEAGAAMQEQREMCHEGAMSTITWLRARGQLADALTKAGRNTPL
ncbi:hypothetical protein I4F81_001771 [Pyropia yezoensis]|uniref:Uncharacterized protein n=1 Tax=Pyropia yezoensis TaxID=2788 RepID=A0ACC3BMG7_PYRYE|nr:hypothetical protein I4F81_001771 [Neopyropia yezoensis]